ncbi:1143_t:CDS:2, partial [Funneliformis geosporum]
DSVEDPEIQKQGAIPRYNHPNTSHSKMMVYRYASKENTTQIFS